MYYDHNQRINSLFPWNFGTSIEIKDYFEKKLLFESGLS